MANYSELEDIGFGLIEVGTVTPKAQPAIPNQDYTVRKT